MRGEKMQNQGVIKIHTPSPYEKIDADTQEWLNKLKEVWPLWRNTPAMSQMLFSYFSSSKDPFKSVLTLIVSCGDFKSTKKSSLSFNIMRNFSNWVNMQSTITIPKSLKLDALNLIANHPSWEFRNLVMKTFGFAKDKEIFVDHIKQLAANRYYKEACQLAVYLKLHDQFGIEEFLVPLIFQDRFPVAHLFLYGSKKHQLELAVFLDGVMGKPNLKQECKAIAKNLGISRVKDPFLKYKPLSKILQKMIKMYDLPPEMCVNLNQRKRKGIVQFLLQKRYVEKSINEESWREMVVEVIGDDEALHVEVVRSLPAYGDTKEALLWAKRLGVDQKLWPKRLLNLDQGENTEEEDCKRKDDADPNLKYHKFPLEESQIKMIDTAEGFNDFLSDITNGISIVGIDAEWKPSFWREQNDVALLQVATYHAVYILDVIALVSAAPSSLWERFASFLFDNPDVVKLGFDTRTDLHMLQDIFRKVHCPKTFNSGFLDLAVLRRVLTHKYKFVFPFPADSKESANLSSLIEMCLGEVLDKSNQFSNWEKRPLRRGQILYAAIDAYCLLEAYDVILKQSKSQNIPILDVIEEILYEKLRFNNKNNGEKRKKKKPAPKTKPKPNLTTSNFNSLKKEVLN